MINRQEWLEELGLLPFWQYRGEKLKNKISSAVTVVEEKMSSTVVAEAREKKN